MGSIRKYIFAPVLVVSGILTVFLFQNCSKEVEFDSRPSASLPDIPEGAVNANGTIAVGGNPDVVVRFTETPTDRTVADPAGVIDFEVTTPTGGSIVSVDCALNGVKVECKPNDRITLPPSGPGPQEFTIVATTDTGITGRETISWTVYNGIVAKQKVINVTTLGDTVDIIINVDNSGSMQEEQQKMAARTSSFMAPFSGLNYHIAVTTTSPSNSLWLPSLNYVDGKFVPVDNAGNHCIRKSEQTLDSAQQLINKNIVRDLYLRDANGNKVQRPDNGKDAFEGNAWERGIYTTYRAFERASQPGTPENNCLRPNTPKHVIVISDERETTTQDDGVTPLSELAKSDGDNLRNLVSSIYGPDTIFKFHSIIANPYTEEGAYCLKTQAAKPGIEYAELSRKTAGEIGSICAPDYSEILTKIGRSITDSFLTYALDCVAVANTDGKLGNVLNAAGADVNTGYVFSGDKVEFAQLLTAGSYTVNYFCYQ